MSIFNCLSKKACLLISFCISLAGVAQAGEMNETGSGSQGTTGSSQGIKGSPEGSSGTSRSTYDSSPGGSGSSQGSSGTSPGTSGTSQGTTGNMGSSQRMSRLQTFQGADKNSDNYVTKSELNASPSLLKYFDKVDVNKDGKLEENEYKNLIMENVQ